MCRRMARRSSARFRWRIGVRSRRCRWRPGSRPTSPQLLVSETDVEFAVAALVARWPNHCRGTAHRWAARRRSCWWTSPRSRCERSPAFRADAADRRRGCRTAAHVLFAAAVGAEPFRIYRADVSDGGDFAGSRERAEARSRRTSPPDGARVVFVGNTADGYDLFTLPLDDARWTPVGGASGRSAPRCDRGRRGHSPAGRRSGPTLPCPRSRRRSGRRPSSPTATNWSIGAATGSADALGRHAYGIEAGWSVRARPDWQIAYAYDRWRPTLFAAYSDDTDGMARGRGSHARGRDGRAAGVAARAQRRNRCSRRCTSATTSTTVRACEAAVGTVACAGPPGAAGVAFSNAHQFGYSISAEEGGRCDGDGGGLARSRSRHVVWTTSPGTASR